MQTNQTGTPTPPAPHSAEAVQARLATIEALLQQQNTTARKTSRLRAVQTILLLCLVLAVGWGMLALNRTVANAVQPLPALIETTQNTVQQTGSEMQRALSGLNEVDFDALRESVENLQAVTESLRAVTDLFGGG